MTVAPARRAATALLTGALLTGCAPSAPELAVVRAELSGQAVQGVTADGVPVRALVVYLHGADQVEAVTTDAPGATAMTRALAGAGYAVVSSAAGGNSFGSPDAQQDYRELVDAASERYGTDSTFFLAESMGALAAVPLAASGTVPGLLATAGVSPALDLDAPSGEGYRDAVVAAWGSEDAVRSPLALEPDRLAGQPFRFYVSDDDEVVPTAEHAGAFAERFGSVADVELVPCTGPHVDGSCFRPDDVVRWFDSFLPPAGPGRGRASGQADDRFPSVGE